jgi:CDP-6-deoxy-D-xylo-4-hexulose-3-dehydrase
MRQVAKMEWLIRRRSENHNLYRQIFADRFTYQRYDAADSVVCSIHFGMLARDPEERRKIVSALEDHGVETRIFSAGNLGLHPFWYNRYGKASFPMADRIHHTGLFLPNNPSLTVDDIKTIADIVLTSVS